jgi:lipooligosaccharide transport system ATP-binding protein
MMVGNEVKFLEYAVLAKQLTKNYGELQAVAGIDLAIPRGEYFGILGPNGAGKTTTVAMIYCFLPVSRGSLQVLGHDTDRDARLIKARLGVVPQENNLDLELTVMENLVVYASYFGIPRQTATQRGQEQLDFFELNAKRDVSVNSLSGGMKRRLTIARAMMNQPDILILDEPTTGLDPEARHYIWQHLKSLKKNGLTLILTTHYLEEASHLCDRLVVMDEGKILEQGAPAELVERIIGPQVLEVTLPQPAHKPLLEILGRHIRGHLAIGETLYLHTDGAGEDILHRVKQATQVEAYLQRPANLEDVFLKLTGRRFAGA